MKMIFILITVACSLSAMAKTEKPSIRCEVVEHSPCPDYGPTSYHCGRRYVYTVACSVEAGFDTEEMAQKKLIEIKKVLNGQWD